MLSSETVHPVNLLSTPLKGAFSFGGGVERETAMVKDGGGGGTVAGQQQEREERICLASGTICSFDCVFIAFVGNLFRTLMNANTFYEHGAPRC